MARFSAPQKAFAAVDRPAATVWYGLRQKRGAASARNLSGEAPMADKSNDPAAIWQSMIGEMEKEFNSFANQAMTSPEFSQSDEPGRRRDGGRAEAARRADGEIPRLAMNLPSRAQMVGMAERLQSIEGQLNEIKALLHQVHHNSLVAGGRCRAPQPPRTKRPPSEGEQK